MKNTQIILFIFSLVLLSSCTRVVREGQVGVKQKLGKFTSKTHNPGIKFINPFTTRVLVMDIRTQNIAYLMDLPTKEGLTVKTEIALVYHVEKEKARELLETVGPDYENVLLSSYFRSAARDVSSNYMAKDLHTGSREIIERAIEKSISDRLKQRGIVVEAVLLKNITLPPNLYQAIELKLAAEQQAQQMEFILQRERQEAERKVIEAQGIADYQSKISEGLNETVLKYNSIQAFRELASSPNAKVIITDGKSPMIVDTED